MSEQTFIVVSSGGPQGPQGSPGSLSVAGTNLSESPAGTVNLDATLTGLTAVTTADLTVTDDLQVDDDVTLATGSVVTWGGDTNLYRSAANTLKTDDSFHAVSDIKATTGVVEATAHDVRARWSNSSAAALGNMGPSSQSGVQFWSTNDNANIWMQAVKTIHTDSDFGTNTAGKGFRVKEGTNAKMGVTPLGGGGVVQVNTTAVTANSRIFVTHQLAAGSVGFLYISARTAGTSFTITSSNAGDTSTVAWIIFEPA